MEMRQTKATSVTQPAGCARFRYHPHAPLPTINPDSYLHDCDLVSNINGSNTPIIYVLTLYYV